MGRNTILRIIARCFEESLPGTWMCTTVTVPLLLPLTTIRGLPLGLSPAGINLEYIRQQHSEKSQAYTLFICDCVCFLYMYYVLWWLLFAWNRGEKEQIVIVFIKHSVILYYILKHVYCVGFHNIPIEKRTRKQDEENLSPIS